MANEKKFLDIEGVKVLWSKISMEDYPNNSLLAAVINAIDEEKQDKTTSELITLNSNNWNIGLDNRYAQSIVSTIVHENTPIVIVDCKLDGVNLNNDLKILDAWQLVSINNVAQEEQKLTFYSYSKPEVDIPVIIGVV